MHPDDLTNIFGRLNNLNMAYGFPANARPFIVGEVIDHGNEPISGSEYFHLGQVTEFRYGSDLARSFRGQSALRWLNNIGEAWGYFPSTMSFTFVDNHDTRKYYSLILKSI